MCNVIVTVTSDYQAFPLVGLPRKMKFCASFMVTELKFDCGLHIMIMDHITIIIILYYSLFPKIGNYYKFGIRTYTSERAPSKVSR